MRSLILAGVACMALNGCGGSPKPVAGGCDIGSQPAELGRLITSLNDGRTDRAAALAKISEIAVSAGANAATDTNTANSLKCRQTSTLAYAALLDSDARHADAMTGLKLQVSSARPVCDQQAGSRDAGIRASCDVVNTWSRMLTTLQAANTIIGLGQGSAVVPRSASTPVSDEIWPKVGEEIVKARAEIRTWAALPDRPDLREIKLGVGCQLVAAITTANFWPFSSSDAKGTHLSDVRIPTYREIAAAARIPASCTDATSTGCDTAASELQTACARRAVSG